jgi:hypothetical protein
MTLTIHKFPITIHTTSHIFAGKTFDPIHVGYQHGNLTVWAEIEKEDTFKYQYDFNVYGTGWDIPSNEGSYVGTVVDEHAYVWHVYFKRIP